jgi:hypothetical protein
VADGGVDSSVVVAAGSSAGAGVASVGFSDVALGADSGVLVAAGSSALLQPANKANVNNPVAMISLVFIVVSY